MGKILFLISIFSIFSARANVSIERCFPNESFTLRKNSSAQHFSLWKSRKNIIIKIKEHWFSTKKSHCSEFKTLPKVLRGVTLLSSTYLYPFEYLKKVSLVNEVLDKKYFYTNLLNVKELKAVTRESLYLSKSNLILGYPKTMDPKDPFTNLINKREGVVPILDYLEESPLARAEWGVVISYLIGDGEKFEEHYQNIRRNYLTVKAKIKSKTPIKVLNAQTYLGEWFVTPKNGHISKLLFDVGISNSIKQGSSRRKISREKLIGDTSKYWLVLGLENSRQKLIKSLGPEKKYLMGKTWINFSKKISPNGANDYWQTGVMRPDILLNDLAIVFYHSNPMGIEAHWFEVL